MGMRRVAVDLHVHTCLSPCADLEMTPARIVGRAVELGIGLMAVSDHNSARNAGVAVELGQRAGITVLPAMEITTAEEAHVLGIFPGMAEALSMQERVYASLPVGPEVVLHDAGHDGGHRWQVVVNALDEVLDFERVMLLGATDMDLGAVVAEIKARGGLAIASHLDRGAFSVMSQMGFVPGDVIFDAVEVIDEVLARTGLMFHPGMTMVRSSDAHHIQDFGRRRTVCRMAGASFEELSLALMGAEGRAVESIGG